MEKLQANRLEENNAPLRFLRKWYQPQHRKPPPKTKEKVKPKHVVSYIPPTRPMTEPHGGMAHHTIKSFGTKGPPSYPFPLAFMLLELPAIVAMEALPRPRAEYPVRYGRGHFPLHLQRRGDGGGLAALRDLG